MIRDRAVSGLALGVLDGRELRLGGRGRWRIGDVGGGVVSHGAGGAALCDAVQAWVGANCASEVEVSLRNGRCRSKEAMGLTSYDPPSSEAHVSWMDP